MHIHEYPKATRVFFETAVNQLAKMDTRDVCNRTGVTYDSKKAQYVVPFLGSDATISSKDYGMTWAWSVDSLYHITILHYLTVADGSKPKGELISLHDVAPKGSTRINQMLHTNIPPLVATFGHDLDLFFETAKKLGGVKRTDNMAHFCILPHIPVQITIWPEDDEFPADANILFDKTLHRQLYPEDIVYTADVVVQALVSVVGK